MVDALNNFSVLWLILSATVGGAIGASIKFLFEKIFASRHQRNFEAREALHTYSFQLFQAAKSLHRRLEFLINNQRDRDLYNEHQQGYSIYKLSTLYPLCNYLGWASIVQDEALQKFSYISKRTKRFYILFYNVFKAMSSISYFQNSEATLEGEYEESSIPAFVLSAIGEQMRIKEKGNSKFVYRVMGFHNFVLLIKTNEEFRNWIQYLDSFFTGIESSPLRKDWNRLLIIAIHIRFLEQYLDKKNKYSIHKSAAEFINKLHPYAAKNLEFDLAALVKHKIIRKE